MRNANPALMARPGNEAAPNELIEQITVDAHGEDEQLWAFRQAFEDGVTVPSDAFVIGEAVSVLKFDYDGNERRGLTAKCCRQDGREYIVSASDVVFHPGAEGGRYVAAYRKWMGLPPFPPEATASATTKMRHETAGSVIHAKDMVELVVLSVLSATQQTARCRFLGIERTVTLRTRRAWVPGEIVGAKVRKKWTSVDPHLSAEIKSERIDATALGLTSLRLEDRGIWNPIEEYWGEEGEAIEGWAKRIIAYGPRRAFEMEQVLPGLRLRGCGLRSDRCIERPQRLWGYSGRVQDPDGRLSGRPPLPGCPCTPRQLGLWPDAVESGRGGPSLRSGFPDWGVVAACGL